ncbi:MULTISPECIES: alpha/beta hydrolase [Marinobacter]|uniref:Alpha/beta hydrolase n=1 Tax=Marinobacter xiaoshiensis TaxID=3073652 RepID=A0ABU2HKY8_9GAMM|nr:MULTISPECIES: alpha/beta hydrolase [unclassified Marinobacter]MBK1886829.1 alpha/beta hydrolase [Marinobacter sp. DY40_1A1]MDS1311729.1 alpha/beta hydrolase [Marinobacter sp. F60267]
MFWIIATVVLFIVALTFLLFRIEDLSHLDKETYSVRATSPSAENQNVLERLKEMRRAGIGLRGKARLMALRKHLDSLSDGLELTSEFRRCDNPRGEWVIAPGCDTRRRILYIHGGAWAAGSSRSHRAITNRLSHIANAAVFAVDYRLMPEHRFMDGVRDCREAYTWLVDNGPEGAGEASFILVAGDSAGGSHTLGLLAWIRDSGLRQANGAVAFSPSTDLTLSAPSNRNNISTDPMLGPVFGGLSKIPKPVIWWATLAAFRISPTSPVASPLLGNLADLPPILIQASTSEMLLDNARRYAAKANAAGSQVELHTWSDMVHVWQIFTPVLPEAEEAFADVEAFIKKIEAVNRESEMTHT